MFSFYIEFYLAFYKTSIPTSGPKWILTSNLAYYLAVFVFAFHLILQQTYLTHARTCSLSFYLAYNSGQKPGKLASSARNERNPHLAGWKWSKHNIWYDLFPVLLVNPFPSINTESFKATILSICPLNAYWLVSSSQVDPSSKTLFNLNWRRTVSKTQSENRLCQRSIKLQDGSIAVNLSIIGWTSVCQHWLGVHS